MDRQKCKSIGKRLEQVFATVADDFKKEFGVAIKVGNARYSSANVEFKVEFAEFGEGGIIETKEVSAFKRDAVYMGLKAEDFGKTFISRGEKFTICGLKPKCYKFPILAKNQRGKTYKFTASDVRRALGYKPDPIYDDQIIGGSNVGNLRDHL